MDKDKFSCSDDDSSASVRSSPPPRLSSPSLLHRSPLLYDNYDIGSDDDGNGDEGDGDEGEGSKSRSYEPYNSEEERDINSLIANYDIVRKY